MRAPPRHQASIGKDGAGRPGRGIGCLAGLAAWQCGAMPADPITKGAGIPLGALGGPVDVLEVYRPPRPATATAACRCRC
jgi:hypothetical protein